MKLSIIIPAYNEERTIAEILDRVVAFDSLGYSKEIIVINDASKDSTAEIVRGKIEEYRPNSEIELKLLENDPNLGKTRSVKKGIAESSGDLVVIQDADLEYNPDSLTEFLRLFKEDSELDAVYGNRFGKKNKVIYWQNWIGNRALTLFSNLFTVTRGVWVSDMEVCYKMVKGEFMREVAAEITSSSGFGFEPEITARLSRKHGGLNIRQVSIDYEPRSIEEGKHMSAFKDGSKALVEIIRYNLFS